MPRNAQGVYSLPSGNPVVTGTTIDSTWANPTLSDIANEITASLPRNGLVGMTGPLILAGDATVPLQATPLQQTTSKIAEHTALTTTAHEIPAQIAEHAALTTTAHGIPAQIATHAALTTTAHNIPSQIDSKIATHAALTTAHNLTALLALKANLYDANLTGTPTTPTAPITTNNTQIATTAFARNLTVYGAVSGRGHSIRFQALGIQLCWYAVFAPANSGSGSDVYWTFPYSFNATPFVFTNPRSGSPDLITSSCISSTISAARITGVGPSTPWSGLTIDVFAVGLYTP